MVNQLQWMDVRTPTVVSECDFTLFPPKCTSISSKTTLHTTESKNNHMSYEETVLHLLRKKKEENHTHTQTPLIIKSYQTQCHRIHYGSLISFQLSMQSQ